LFHILINKKYICAGGFMASNHSFDIVSEVDFQEIDNALNQANKELLQRYDLKDSATEIVLNKKEKQIIINTKDDYSRKQSVDILQTKFIKRNISLKVMKLNEPETAGGGRLKQIIDLQNGISKENAKLIIKLIKDNKVKVTTQIQDEQLRVTAAKIDELQSVIKLVKEADFDFAVQFTNYK
jgi:cyclic-di-GMP-binding protein